MKRIKFIDDNLVGQDGLSRYIDPKSLWNREISDYDICIYTDQKCFNDVDSFKQNYAWIIEPPIINGENYQRIIQHSSKFNKVFSYMSYLGEQISNYVYIPHGGTWLRDSELRIYDKTKLCSSIFSHKTWNTYHRMRHNIYNNLKHTNTVDFFGSGSDNPIEFKITALKDYMFSIVIENSIEDCYFTEKLLDCFLTGTIPIYCGHKNISKFFDTNGILFFNEEADLPSILETLTESLYASMKDSINTNFHLAHKYIHPEKLINEYV
jgi:hypothetical protein